MSPVAVPMLLADLREALRDDGFTVARAQRILLGLGEGVLVDVRVSEHCPPDRAFRLFASVATDLLLWFTDDGGKDECVKALSKYATACTTAARASASQQAVTPGAVQGADAAPTNGGSTP